MHLETPCKERWHVQRNQKCRAQPQGSSSISIIRSFSEEQQEHRGELSEAEAFISRRLDTGETTMPATEKLPMVEKALAGK